MKKITNIILEPAYLLLKKIHQTVHSHLRAEPLNLLDPSAIGIDLDFGTGSSHVVWKYCKVAGAYS